MFFLEIIKKSLQAINVNKLRSSLTLLALVIGIFAIIVTNTAVEVLDHGLKSMVSFMGGDVLTVRKYPIVRNHRDRAKYRNRKDITFQLAENLDKKLIFGQDVAPDDFFRIGSIKYDGKETEGNVLLRGSNHHFLNNRAYDIERGRNLTELDVQYARNYVVIGSDVVEALFNKQEDPLQKEIRVDGRKYTVIGVTQPKGNVFGNSLDNFVLAPYTTLINYYGNTNRNVNNVYVKAGSYDLIEKTKENIIEILRILRKVQPGELNDFDIETNETLGGTFDELIGMLSWIGIIIGGITLLGAGIGVTNIMLVSVSERTKEIGVCKAVGARKKSIVWQFLLEAVFLCQIGGIIGSILGVLVGNLLITNFTDFDSVIPWQGIIIGFTTMNVVGLAFGVVPAYRAASIDPIKALHHT